MSDVIDKYAHRPASPEGYYDWQSYVNNQGIYAGKKACEYARLEYYYFREIQEYAQRMRSVLGKMGLGDELSVAIDYDSLVKRATRLPDTREEENDGNT